MLNSGVIPLSVIFRHLLITLADNVTLHLTIPVDFYHIRDATLIV